MTYDTGVDTVAWLLDADPAIRWQAMRDLTDASPAEIAAERARVPREGLGAAILAAQHADGAWRRSTGSTWLPTLFTLQLLRATGADPADPAVASAIARLDGTLGWDNRSGYWELGPLEPGVNPYFAGEVEPCINGGVLALGAYFGRPTKSLVQRLLGDQLADGGWNCEAPPSTCSSFHTTICVLVGLLDYERAVGGAPEIAAARRRGEEYLLERRLFRRRSTGEVVDPAFLELAFPPRYRYDVLRALDYFRGSGSQADPRMSEAVSRVESKRRADGRWQLERAHAEALAVPIGESPGDPSRWNTLRALRVVASVRP